jgi:hypothetical protein
VHFHLPLGAATGGVVPVHRSSGVTLAATSLDVEGAVVLAACGAADVGGRAEGLPGPASEVADGATSQPPRSFVTSRHVAAVVGEAAAPGGLTEPHSPSSRAAVPRAPHSGAPAVRST